jgi:hypothetical protein
MFAITCDLNIFSQYFPSNCRFEVEKKCCGGNEESGVAGQVKAHVKSGGGSGGTKAAAVNHEAASKRLNDCGHENREQGTDSDQGCAAQSGDEQRDGEDNLKNGQGERGRLDDWVRERQAVVGNGVGELGRGENFCDPSVGKGSGEGQRRGTDEDAEE